MFKLAQKTSYTWPVTVHIPADGGRFTKAGFDAEFKALPQERIDDYLAGRGNDDEADFLNEVVIGWKGVADDAGADVPYSEDAKPKLLAIPYVRTALVRAFFESITGGAKRKN